MKTILIPPEILEPLKNFCKENQLGLGSAFGDGYGILVMGPNNTSPDVIALAAAVSLIEGVLSNAWVTSDEANKEVKIISEEPDRVQ